MTPLPPSKTGIEYPKRMTARNEEGKAIQTRATNQDKYAEGWDLIFKNKKGVGQK